MPPDWLSATGAIVTIFVGNWAVDKRWKPQMNEDRRAALFGSWQKAVGRSLDWVD